ncbi:MAG: DUF362 domain-containing protein [Nitrospirae bacterium]|nr:MAG: DUF362 domain-containing protein [Nitrospirota bacterium]
MHEQRAFGTGPPLTRRQLLKITLAGGLLAASGTSLWQWTNTPRLHAATFIGAAATYDLNLTQLIGQGFHELGITAATIRGKRILLKPNLVETHPGHEHINTHPFVVRAAAEAFLRLGASRVLVGEGPGHRQDTLQILEESGLAEVLNEDHIPFMNLNDLVGTSVPNAGKQTALSTLTFPTVLHEVDWIVSMPKMKTHHWTGVTLSMKNLFGLMPGLYYGWPKNVFHHAGLHESILDITATLKPHFAIVDGIVGMEGDGPLMGTPKPLGVLVMGRNLPAVDATCARLMGIDPYKIGYLSTAENWLGPIHERDIEQRGERIDSHQQPFRLLEHIPATRDIQLVKS